MSEIVFEYMPSIFQIEMSWWGSLEVKYLFKTLLSGVASSDGMWKPTATDPTPHHGCKRKTEARHGAATQRLISSTDLHGLHPGSD